MPVLAVLAAAADVRHAGTKPRSSRAGLPARTTVVCEAVAPVAGQQVGAGTGVEHTEARDQADGDPRPVARRRERALNLEPRQIEGRRRDERRGPRRREPSTATPQGLWLHEQFDRICDAIVPGAHDRIDRADGWELDRPGEGSRPTRRRGDLRPRRSSRAPEMVVRRREALDRHRQSGDDLARVGQRRPRTRATRRIRPFGASLRERTKSSSRPNTASTARSSIDAIFHHDPSSCARTNTSHSPPSPRGPGQTEPPWGEDDTSFSAMRWSAKTPARSRRSSVVPSSWNHTS